MGFKTCANCLLILSLTLSAFAETRKITLAPAPATRPALKYRLFPDPSSLENGNAMEVYQKNTDELDALDDEGNLSVYARRNLVSEDFEKAKICLEKSEKFLQQAKAAAKISSLKLEPVKFESLRPLNTGSHLATLAGLALLKARIDGGNGQTDSAVEWMRVANQIGFHLMQSGNQYMATTGMQIEQHVVEVAIELGESPRWPNLYWPIAQLPSQKQVVGQTFDSETRDFKEAMKSSKDPLTLTINDLKEAYLAFAPLEQKELGLSGIAEITLRNMLSQGPAEEYMRLKGFSDQQIKSYEPIQVVCFFYFNPMREYADEYAKLAQCPYPYAIEQVHKLNKDVAKESVKGKTPDAAFATKNLINPFQQLAEINIFSFELLLKPQGRLDRQIAIGKIIQALRDYAFAHNNELPASLDEIKNLPIDNNPMTGKPFDWEKTGKTTGTLSAPKSPEDRNDSSIRYEIEIKP